MPISSQLQGTIGFTNPVAPDAFGGSTTTFGPYAFNLPFLFGTGPGQIQKAYYDHQVVTNNTVNYILSALPGGQGVAVVRKIALIVISPYGTVGSGTFGPGATHPWNGMGSQVITPGHLRISAWGDVGAPTVAAGSADQIAITVSGTLEYLLAIEGY